MRNYPWYRGWHSDFAAKGVTVLGVHTPESKGEADIAAVRAKAKDQKLDFPIAIDNTWATWKAWENRYWPATYLIDRQGDVRYRWYGELHYNGVKGQELMKKKIEELLAEKGEAEVTGKE